MERNRIPGGLWRVHTDITREQAKVLKQIADKKGISRAKLIRIIVDLYLWEKM